MELSRMKAMIERTLSVGSRSRPFASTRGRIPPFSHFRGFTLIEVLMSVTLMGIGIALALPSYRDMVEKRQVTNAAEQLAAFVNSVQGAAMAAAETGEVMTQPQGPTEAQQQLLASLSVKGTPPELNNEVWLNSDPLKLSDLRGKVVIVEFWTFG